MTLLEKINIKQGGPARILIAPLDWGLGHTTRCLPIVKAFQRQGAEISVACNEPQAGLLKPEIQGIRLLRLEGYGLQYAGSERTTTLKIALQIPKILTSIKRENQWLRDLLNREKFDLVISDNRYGLHHPSVYSIFMTHQLRIQVPFSSWLENRLQKRNYHFINQFDECWIPDLPNEPNLAGSLSHPAKLPATKVKYIGPISRFKEVKSNLNSHDLVIIISGPEPQRTIFEKKCLSELKDFNGTAIVVRGLPVETTHLENSGNVSFFNHLPADELGEILGRAKFVVSRSGYSTIMDMAALKKKSIFIPTPGQTEQEYLAEYLMEKKFCFAIKQKDFSLQAALSRATNFEYADFSQYSMSQIDTIAQGYMKGLLKETKLPDVSNEI